MEDSKRVLSELNFSWKLWEGAKKFWSVSRICNLRNCFLEIVEKNYSFSAKENAQGENELSVIDVLVSSGLKTWDKC